VPAHIPRPLRQLEQSIHYRQSRESDGQRIV